MVAAGILPLLISLAVDSPYDSNEMSRKACKTLGNLTATLESATAIIKVQTYYNILITSSTIDFHKKKWICNHMVKYLLRFLVNFMNLNPGFLDLA